MRSRPGRTAVLLAGIGLVCAGVVASATSVIAPTFTELVNKAQTVFVGETIDVRSEWVSTSSGRAIFTRVTFKVDRIIKGHVGPVTVLEFLGGRVGDDALEIAGMPKFRSGDRDLLFVDDRGRQMSPIVGFMHGRFRLMRDPATGRDLVSRYNYQALTSVDELGQEPLPRIARQRTMMLDDFEAEITRALRRVETGR